MPGIFKDLFSGSPEGYKPEITGQAERGAMQGVASRAGAKKDPKTGEYDFSKSFQPIQGAAGVQQAKRGYSFDPMSQATEGLGQRRRVGRLDFKGLPQKYGSMAYERGAKDIRREGSGQLTQLQEALGTRRPDMLYKAARDAQRSQGENLADLGSDIARDVMGMETDLDVKEQVGNVDIQRAEELMDLDRLGKLFDVGRGTVETESGLVQRDRDYEDRALQFLMDLWKSAGGFAGQAAETERAGRGDTFNMLGNIAGAMNPFGGGK